MSISWIIVGLLLAVIGFMYYGMYSMCKGVANFLDSIWRR